MADILQFSFDSKIPRKLSEISGIGIYTLKGTNQTYIGRTLMASEKETMGGVERILIPYINESDEWGLKIEEGFRDSKKRPIDYDFSYFPFFDGFKYFPEYSKKTLYNKFENTRLWLSIVHGNAPTYIYYYIVSRNQKNPFERVKDDIKLASSRREITFSEDISRLPFFNKEGRYFQI